MRVWALVEKSDVTRCGGRPIFGGVKERKRLGVVGEIWRAEKEEMVLWLRLAQWCEWDVCCVDKTASKRDQKQKPTFL